MPPFTLDEPTLKDRRLTHWATDAAVIVLLFGPLLSAWTLVIVAAASVLGLLLYALVTKDPASRWLATRALLALFLGAIVALGVLLFR